ncbi:hypothetical protein EXIGLDRAFT_753521 [Exidia glandulosa HHB12029]|uniref:Protein kinase domain-containing protein n=1 Tax=Exidia glandulosa HHB12029 TaxID=1314781 RepID=A0A165DP71_EXIGL|nr:hypothetical protein EXIGLDRAFT_753521 [Exidia glandulosa HHB12029]
MLKKFKGAGTSALGGTLEGATVTIQVAKELSSGTPLVAQILASAAHISELAERFQKKRDAMYELIERSGIYAAQIEAAVAGRVLHEQLHLRLERLHAIFAKIEDLTVKAADVKLTMARRVRDAFVNPTRAERLDAELQREIQLFELTIAIDTRLVVSDVSRLIEEDATYYDGEFRRLRQCDVHKLDVIAERRTDEGVITWAGAEVDGKVMVVRYLEGLSEFNQPGAAWTAYPELIKQLSSVNASHRNVVTLYGIHRSQFAFTVFRSGTLSYREWQESHRNCLPNKEDRLRNYMISDALQHLQYGHNLVWSPSPSGNLFFMDDTGNPKIGLLDDITRWDGGTHEQRKALTLTTPLLFFVTSQTEVVERSFEGRLRILVEKMLSTGDCPALAEIWERQMPSNISTGCATRSR